MQFLSYVTVKALAAICSPTMSTGKIYVCLRCLKPVLTSYNSPEIYRISTDRISAFLTALTKKQ